MFTPSDKVPTASGDLVKTPLAHVIVFVADKRLSGSLVLHGDDASSSTLLFSSGAPAKVFTTYPGTYLGRVLLQLGFIDDALMDASFAEAQKTNMLHGQMLRALGAIDDAQLAVALREQMMRRLLNVFEKLGERATYSFYANENLLHDFGGPELTPVDPHRVVWEGMRMRPNDPCVDPTLDRLANAPIAMSNQVDLRRFGFGPAEFRVTEMLGLRPMPLAQILDMDLMPVRKLKLLVYSLLITKSIVVLPPTPAPPNKVPAAAHRTDSKEPSSAPLATPPPATPPPATPPPATPPPAMAPEPSTISLQSKHPESADDAHPKSVPMARVMTKKALAYVTKTRLPPPLEVDHILERAKQIENEDYFQVLGIDRDAPPNVTQSAFFSLAKQWHPDRIPEVLKDAREAASKVFSRMSDAHRTLIDPQKRSQYIAALEKGAAALEEQAKVQKVIDATIEFQKAEVFLRKRDMRNALRSAKNAFEGDREQAHHVALYAWLLAQEPDAQKNNSFDQSMVLLEEAIRSNPLCEQAFMYRAMLLKQLGRNKSALRDFRKVVELNPRNIDASREVRFATMRGEISDDDEARAATGSSESGWDARASEGIQRTMDSAGEILGKLFRKKSPNPGRKARP